MTGLWRAILLFIASFCALLWAAGVAFDRFVPWRSYQDPRARLLWDGDYDGSPIVLLGDSEFSSYYVDSPAQTLWARLADVAGVRVFPAALNGAKPDDMLAAARHIAQAWPAGTVVYTDVPPTRFVVTRAEEPPLGNYPDALMRRHGLAPAGAGPLQQLEAAVYRTAVRPFFLVRNREYLGNILDRPEHFGRYAHHHRVWNEDERFARGRFTMFERNVVLDAPPRPFDWLLELNQILRDADFRPALVFTPPNEGLIDAYAVDATRLKDSLRQTQDAAMRYAREHGIDVIDLTGAIPSECFADLVHTNVCGDDIIARRIAEHHAALANAANR